jgi:hypothetical protein
MARVIGMRLFDLRKWLTPGRRLREPAIDGLWPDEEEEHEPPAAFATERVAVAGPVSAWPQSRIEVADQLWGEGCLWPGGTDEVMRVAVPFGLSAASSLLYLGAGSAGPTLRLAGELGVWVCACEADPTLAAVAGKRVQRAGVALAKRATVQGWDMAAPNFRRQAFHHALSIEALRGPRPEDVVAAMCQAVRPGGQVAVVETVAPLPLDPADPAVLGWSRLERRDLPPPGTAWLTRPLGRMGFDIRVSEDVTARHVRLAVAGWKRMVRDMKLDRPPPHRAAAVVAEAEYWLRRIHLLRSGKLRVMRWLAISNGSVPIS